MRTTITPNVTATDQVTTVRSFFEAWTDGDVDASRSLIDPDIVAEPLLGVLYERDFYEGYDGIAGAFREVAERWDRFELKLEQAEEVGNHVVAHVRLDVVKHGMSAALDLALVCTLRRGRIVSLTETVVALAA